MIKGELMMKGQLDHTKVSMPKEAMHNVSGMVGAPVKMKGQLEKGMKELSSAMSGMAKSKVMMKGQSQC
jgi:hypothetical protein